MLRLVHILVFGFSISLVSCVPQKSTETSPSKTQVKMIETTNHPSTDLQKATFGAGCFWCVEAVFQELEGVKSVISGYTGGATKNPTYKEIGTGRTGHAEVCQITYDEEIISFEELLEVFWQTHDPTTLNKQGADIGTQYRSAIFYHNTTQKELAEHYKKELNASGAWNAPIVTEISELKEFYGAENYHQDYYSQNPNQGYCVYVIQPKLEKFRKAFKSKLKKEVKPMR